ncbi:hypothetical protein [Bacillus cereus]|nr:hypothetical protein [Bacillus cereus]
MIKVSLYYKQSKLFSALAKQYFYVNTAEKQIIQKQTLCSTKRKVDK